MTEPTSSSSERRWLGVWLALVALGASWLLTRHLDDSMLGHSQFRQTQTALTIDWVRREGFRVEYLTPLFGPPWSVPMEFPVYQWCAAGLAALTHCSTEVAGRWVSIAFLLGCLPSLVALARRWEPDRWRAWLVPAAALLTPVSLYYSRSVMIESAAAAFALWFLHAFVVALERRTWAPTLLAVVLGALAAMVKITTFATLLVPAAVLFAGAWWTRPELRRRPRFWAAAAAPVTIALCFGALWVRYGDQVKNLNPLSAFLASDKLSGWNFGTLAQRTTALDWWNALSHFLEGTLSGPALVVVGIAAWAAPAAHRRVLFVALAAYFATLAVFFNLYVVHDYYQFAAALLVGAAAGLAIAGAFSRSRWLGAFLLLAFTATQVTSFARNWWVFWRVAPPPPPEITRIVNAALPPDGVVVVYGADWNALVAYHSQRRAIMLPEHRAEDAKLLDDVLPTLPADTPLALLITGEHRTHGDFVRWRTSRMGLRATPLARSADGDLYVSADAVARVRAQFDRAPVPGVEFEWSTPRGPLDPALSPQALEAKDLAPMTNLKLLAAYSKWGLTPTDIDGAPSLLASAPSEVHLDLPPGYRAVTVRFGIVRGAIEGKTPTDGAEAAVVLLGADGRQRVLWRRLLEPRDRAEDRPVQEALIELPVGASGKLICSFSAGPRGDTACDWTFWQKIEIK